MEGHRRKNSWLAIGVGGCCASRDEVASEKKGHGGMLNKSPSSYSATLRACEAFSVHCPLKTSLQLHVGRCTLVCLALCDPHHVELHNHLAYRHLEAKCLEHPPHLQDLPLNRSSLSYILTTSNRTVSCTDIRATSGHACLTNESSGPTPNNRSTHEPTHLAMGVQQSRVRGKSIIPYKPLHTHSTQTITFST